MRYKSLLLTTAVLAGALTMGAQETHTVNDTIFNPKIVFTSSPSTYELAGITVKGVDNYDNNIILGYSGLTIGQRIEVPGDDLKAVAKRFLLAVQRTLESLLQHHNLKASIILCSAFFMVQLSHQYMTKP